MVLVRRLHKRNANIVVEANGEVLFAPEGDVGNWTRRFSARVREASAAYAPANKRPRWAHYGRPLKTTFTVSTTFQPGRMRVYSAIGSTSPHAYYVDQGTGVYAGRGPYAARVLPPWFRGSPSLYEATWRPGNGHWSNAHRVKPVMIKGQKGQGFFDKGLKRGFESMRMRSFQVPGEGLIGGVLNSMPTGLLGFMGNTVSDGAFRASLEEWRAWRDAAYNKGLGLGKYSTRSRYRHSTRAKEAAERRQHRIQANKIRRAEQSKLRSKRWRDKQRSMKSDAAKSLDKQAKMSRQSRAADKAAFLSAMIRKYGEVDLNSLEYRNGYWYILVVESRSAAGNATYKEVRAKAKS